jgi:hypothetical protein
VFRDIAARALAADPDGTELAAEMTAMFLGGDGQPANTNPGADPVAQARLMADIGRQTPATRAGLIDALGLLDPDGERALRAELRAAQAQVADMYRSVSWRLSWPVRKVGLFLRRIGLLKR